MDIIYNFIEWVIYFHISFFVRMLVIFTLMMWYYNWVDKESMLWKVTKFIWYPIAGIFAVIDVVYNWYSWITFKDKPAVWDETFSYRMDRYIKQYCNKINLTLLEKWRYYFAIGLCKVLSFSDPKHCGGI